MKVLQINVTCGYGSTGRICLEISDFLLSQGIDNYIFYGVGNTQRANAEKFCNDIDRKMHTIMSRTTGLQSYFSTVATKRLLCRMDELKPDIVHLHNLHSNYINLPILLKYLAEKDIATVITLHDCWFFTGKCTHYTTDKCYKWKTGCNHCKRLKKDIPSWFLDRTSKMWADKNKLFKAIPRLAVIGVSDWITNEAKQSFFKNASIIRRIYNWIDLDDFHPKAGNIKRKYSISEDKFTILSVSAGWDENSDRFKDAIKLSKLIKDKMQIVLVGAGLSKEKLPKNIIGIDYIEGKDELAEMYSAADVYVHLSREDTFGKVVAEAMACGTPAVVYDSTALPELVGQGNGFAVDCGDIGEVYDIVDKIAQTGKKQYSEQCVDFVKKRFDKAKLLNETVKLYKDIIER